MNLYSYDFCGKLNRTYKRMKKAIKITLIVYLSLAFSGSLYLKSFEINEKPNKIYSLTKKSNILIKGCYSSSSCWYPYLEKISQAFGAFTLPANAVVDTIFLPYDLYHIKQKEKLIKKIYKSKKARREYLTTNVKSIKELDNFSRMFIRDENFFIYCALDSENIAWIWSSFSTQMSKNKIGSFIDRHHQTPAEILVTRYETIISTSNKHKTSKSFNNQVLNLLSNPNFPRELREEIMSNKKYTTINAQAERLNRKYKSHCENEKNRVENL